MSPKRNQIEAQMLKIEQKVEELKKKPVSKDLAIAQNQLASYQNMLVLTKEAYSSGLATLETIKKLNQNKSPEVLFLLCDTYYRMSLAKGYEKNFQQAIKDLTKARKALKKLNAPEHKLHHLLNLHEAMLFFRSDQHSKAYDMFNVVKQHYENNLDGEEKLRQIAKISWLQALPLIHLERLEEAETLLKQAKKLYRQLGETRHYFQYALGKFANSQGNLQKANKHFIKAANILEDRREQLQTEAAKVSFFRDKEKIYHSLICNLANLGQLRDALYYTEMARARAALDFFESGSIKQGRVFAQGFARIKTPESIMKIIPRNTLVLSYFDTG